jgi:hypothetical protein
MTKPKYQMKSKCQNPNDKQSPKRKAQMTSKTQITNQVQMSKSKRQMSFKSQNPTSPETGGSVIAVSRSPFTEIQISESEGQTKPKAQNPKEKRNTDQKTQTANGEV